MRRKTNEEKVNMSIAHKYKRRLANRLLHILRTLFKKPLSLMLLAYLATFLLDESASTPWTPDWLPFRDDLLCPSYCEHQEEIEYDRCCICRSTSAWEGTERNLYIEQVTAEGGIIALSPDKFDQSMFYKIEYTGFALTELPGNICNWNGDPFVSHIIQTTRMANLSSLWHSLVFINLSSNRIKSIPDINCLTRLDRLYLDFNEIEHVSNLSFANIPYLRSVRLNNNRIKTMDPFVVSAPDVNMFLFDMSNNQLKTLDVTNLMTTKRFCQFDFSSNHVNFVTNILDFVLNKNNSYGPGFVSMNNNNFTTFPNIKELLHLNSLAELGQLLGSGFDFRGQPLNCDCHCQEFVNMSLDVLKDLFRDYMNVTCSSPDELKGMFAMEVMQDKLVCDNVPYCPPGCECVDKPSEDTVFVTCSNRVVKLSTMPDYLPNITASHFLSLDLSQNSITKLVNVSGFNRILFLNISQNKLSFISETAIRALPNSSYLDLSNNIELHELPPEIQYRNICKTNLSNLNILCTCDTLWMITWVNRKCIERQNKTLFTCLFEDGQKLPVEQFTKDTIDCYRTEQSITAISICLSVFILLLVGIASCVYLFRYEIFILLMKIRRQKTNSVTPQFKFDTFISIDEENDSLLKWVNYNLVPSLRDMGYSVFLPCMDMLPGEVRDNAVIDIMNDCRNFLLILSESYLVLEESAWIEKEWKYGWNMMKKNRLKSIVLVNFDHVSPSDVEHKQIKAFLRVGTTVDFSNFQGDIINKIAKHLGPPSSHSKKGLNNKKSIFSGSKNFNRSEFVTDIFTVDIFSKQ